MKDLKPAFCDWLNEILRGLDLEPAAYCFNIYENSEDGDYSVELTAFNEYDAYDADWCCGGNEAYASRNDDNEFCFKIQADWEECLKSVGLMIADYLNEGKYAAKLKSAEAVAYGFVDGDLETAFIKNPD